MVNEDLDHVLEELELPDRTRQVQRVLTLPQDAPVPLYQVPCVRCGVTGVVGVGALLKEFRYAEDGLLLYESRVVLTHDCLGCSRTTEASGTMVVALHHDHWEHARDVGCVRLHSDAYFAEGQPGTWVHRAVLLLRCGICSWNEVRAVAERTPVRYRELPSTAAESAGHSPAAHPTPGSATRRRRRPLGES